jgi:hypothetical protein
LHLPGRLLLAQALGNGRLISKGFICGICLFPFYDIFSEGDSASACAYCKIFTLFIEAYSPFFNPLLQNLIPKHYKSRPEKYDKNHTFGRLTLYYKVVKSK